MTPRSHSRAIIDDMIAAFRLMSTTAGDSFTPSIVQRHDEDRTAEGPPFSILVRRITTVKTRDPDTSAWKVDLTVEVRTTLYSGDDSDVASDEVIEEAEEDIWRALSGLDWPARQAEFRSFTPETFRDIDADHRASGFRADVEIEYEIAYDNPDAIIDL